MDTDDDNFSDEYYGSDADSSDTDFTLESDSGDRSEKSYTILSDKDIKQIQNDKIFRIASSLYVSSAFSRVLLNKFKWDVNDLQDSWFDDEDNIRKAVGLVETNTKTLGDNMVYLQKGTTYYYLWESYLSKYSTILQSAVCRYRRSLKEKKLSQIHKLFVIFMARAHKENKLRQEKALKLLCILIHSTAEPK